MNDWLLELWAAPAALGFVLLFNVPPRALTACCVFAVLGHATRKLVMTFGGDLVLATLLGGVAIGLLAEFWAPRQNMAPTVFSIGAAIPMVPGTLMYKAVQSLLGLVTQGGLDNQALLVSAGVNGTKACLTLMALALGIAAPVLLWPTRRQ